MSERTWTVWALKYAERNTRQRSDSFIFDDNHDAPHPMDYFVWVLQSGDQTILVDTGYDKSEAKKRDRPILRDPAVALQDFGLSPETIDTVIITHLHYDHAGGLYRYPAANFHVQAAEMAYATGPCMCHDTLRMPYTGKHVCDLVTSLYSGRVIFHDGDGGIVDGVTVHRIGGHSRGLQAVRVKTESGYLCLASDAAHYYENFLSEKPFPIVVDVADMMSGFSKIQRLASNKKLVVPGHDPLVTKSFPRHEKIEFAWRLDRGPTTSIEGL